MASNKKYWRSVEELNEDSSIIESLQQNEFTEEIPTDEFLGDKDTLEDASTSRRDFLKFVGFTTAAASLAACEGPVIKSVPYVIKPEEITPGVANYYATAIADGYDFANVLVKTREGRPIKIERNTLAKANTSVNARVQASVLSLYDSNRVMSPMIADAAVTDKVDESDGQDVGLRTQTIARPTITKLIDEFQHKYPPVRPVVYDPVSSSEALDAFQNKFGYRALPDYDVTQADVIVSVNADFLGDWQGGGFDSGYAKGRVPKDGKMSRHVHFEANMTLTGANADKRVIVNAAQQKQVVKALTGNGSTSGLPENVAEAVKNAKKQLDAAGNKGVLVTGLPDFEAQQLALDYNVKTSSKALDTERPKFTRMGSSTEVTQVIKDVVSGKVKGLITVGVDPLYSFPNAEQFAEAYQALPLSLAFSMKPDATASAAKLVAATPHYLESWGDLEVKKGHYSLMQPTIKHLFDTRQFQDSLLKWIGGSDSYYDYIRSYWRDNVLNGSSWNNALHDGVYIASNVEKESNVIRKDVPLGKTSMNVSDGGFELHLYTKTGLGDGRQANNPWLQELPDPITRTAWDN